jgi:signal recognition particle subunit SRP54
MLPGIAKMKDQLANANLDDKVIRRQVAIINSMTPAERRNPDLLKASRKKRIAAGAGTGVEQVNKLLKMHRQMADMMKMMAKTGKRGPMAGLANMFGLGGGVPPIDPSKLDPKMLEQLKDQMPGGFPGAGGGIPAAPPAGLFGAKPSLPGLPGLGKPGGLPGGLPGLGGFNPFGGKKK